VYDSSGVAQGGGKGGEGAQGIDMGRLVGKAQAELDGSKAKQEAQMSARYAI
jgi:hypothetical protein